MRSTAALLICAASIGTVLVFVESPVALSIVLTDGLPAILVLALAAVPGTVLLRAIVGNGMGGVGCAVYGAGLGVGILCLLEFGLGLAGRLDRASWIASFGAILLIATGTQALRIRRAIREDARVRLPSVEAAHWLWLAVVPFAAVTMVVATAPPGVLWPEEGNGYDVLEYHLAVPKTNYEAGRITCLPNNVYAAFPLNVEMLYLLAMVLRGGAIEGILMAQMFNALLACLAVAAVWASARPLGPRAAVVAGTLTGTCGWLVYLSGVAYVENGLVLFTALALGAWMRWYAAGAGGQVAEAGGRADPGADASRPDAFALLSGLFAGLACGCKYTAAVLVAIPLGIMFVWQALSARCGAACPAERRTAFRGSTSPPPESLRETGERYRGSGIRAPLLFALGLLGTFGPWLARNAVTFGNPVFPLATRWIGYRPGVWDAESESRWVRGHQPAEELRSPQGRIAMLWRGVLAHPRVGPAIWLLALAGAVTGRRMCGPLCAIVGMQILLWTGTTTLVERFAVPILPPLILLAAHAAADAGRARFAALAVAVMLGASANLYHIGGLYYDRSRLRDADGRVQKIPWHGQIEWFLDGQWPGTAHWGCIDRDLPREARVLLVGDARPFYVRRPCDYAVVFNPHPLARVVRDGRDAAAVLAWLRGSGFTHVYVDWAEMKRLRSTYGFWPEIDEALFVRLEGVGLRRHRDFAAGEGARPYGTIYEVPK